MKGKFNKNRKKWVEAEVPGWPLTQSGKLLLSSVKCKLSLLDQLNDEPNKKDWIKKVHKTQNYNLRDLRVKPRLNSAGTKA